MKLFSVCFLLVLPLDVYLTSNEENQLRGGIGKKTVHDLYDMDMLRGGIGKKMFINWKCNAAELEKIKRTK